MLFMFPYYGYSSNYCRDLCSVLIFLGCRLTATYSKICSAVISQKPTKLQALPSDTSTCKVPFAMPESVQVGQLQLKQNIPTLCGLCCHCQDAGNKLILKLFLLLFPSSSQKVKTSSHLHWKVSFSLISSNVK